MAKHRDRGSRGSSDDSKSKSTRSWYSLAFLVLVCGGGLPVVLQIFDKASSLLSKGYETLDVANTEQIRSVFFSGEPWVVMCSSDEETPEEAAVLSVLDRVGKMSDTNLKQGVPAMYQRYRVGVVRCDLPLPSKQTILERFKIKRQGRLPTVLVVANGDRPSPVNAGVLQDVVSAASGSSSSSPTPASTLLAQATQRLFEHIRARVEPKLAYFSTTNHVKKHCVEKPRCVIAVAQAELTKPQQAAMAILVDKYRNVRFGAVNLNFSDFSLSDRLGFTNEPTSPKESEVRFVYFRKPSTDASGSDGEAPTKPGATLARAFKEPFSLSAAQSFIDSSLALPNEASKDSGLVALKKCPTLTSRRHARYPQNGKGEKEKETKPRSASGSKPSRPKEPERPAKHSAPKASEPKKETPKPAAKKEDIYAGARKHSGPKREDGMRAEALDEEAIEEEGEGESEPEEEEGEEVIDLDDSEL